MGLVGLLGLVMMIVLAQGPSITIPSAVSQRIQFPIYLPHDLPGTYKLSEDSFALADEVLIFEAKDGVGTNLLFSAQPKPQDFDFANFYNTQLLEAKTLSDVPYPSVWGKTIGGSTLSIVTHDCWILMTTSAPLDHQDMARIAASVKKL